MREKIQGVQKMYGQEQEMGKKIGNMQGLNSKSVIDLLFSFIWNEV